MTRPVRILQVLGGMELGGAETWLMHVLRKIDREQFRIDFLVHAAEKCAYDDEVLALGSRLLRCPSPSLSLSYPRACGAKVRMTCSTVTCTTSAASSSRSPDGRGSRRGSRIRTPMPEPTHAKHLVSGNVTAT